MNLTSFLGDFLAKIFIFEVISCLGVLLFFFVCSCLITFEKYMTSEDRPSCNPVDQRETKLMGVTKFATMFYHSTTD